MKKMIVSLATLVFRLASAGRPGPKRMRTAMAAVQPPTAGIPPRAPTLTVAARLTLPDREPLPPTHMVALLIMRKDLEKRLPPTLTGHRDAHRRTGNQCLQRIWLCISCARVWNDDCHQRIRW